MDKTLFETFDYYEKNLSRYFFVFYTEAGTMKIDFDQKCFPHLAGIHHVFPNSDEFTGEAAVKKIVSKCLTYESMEAENEQAFREFVREKQKYLYKFFKALVNSENVSIVKLDKESLKKKTKINADYGLYLPNQNIWLFLCLVKTGHGDDANTEFLRPMSFVVRKGETFLTLSEKLHIFFKEKVLKY